MNVNNEIKRPFLNYFGAKWKIAPWIISFIPAHRNYIEPFGGSAAVLLRKPRSHTEVYNDLDGNVVNAFRVLRDRPKELLRLLDLTPYSREEYERAFEGTDDALEKARRFIVKCWMGHSQTAGLKDGEGHPGFSTAIKASGGSRARSWVSYVDALSVLVDRLRYVQIEHLPVLDLFPLWDEKNTVWYLDPPYVAKTRVAKNQYRFEMTEADHTELLARAVGLKGMVLLSGYASELYDSVLSTWERYERPSFSGSSDRVEVLWVKRAST